MNKLNQINTSSIALQYIQQQIKNTNTDTVNVIKYIQPRFYEKQTGTLFRRGFQFIQEYFENIDSAIKTCQKKREIR